MRKSVSLPTPSWLRLPDNVSRDRLRQQIARDRHEPEDGVKADADAGAGDDEQRVHYAGDRGHAGHGGAMVSRSKRSMRGRVLAT